MESGSNTGLERVEKDMQVEESMSFGARMFGLFEAGVVTLVAVFLVFVAFYVSNTRAAISQGVVAGLSPDMVLVSPIPPSSTGLDYGVSSNSLTTSDVSALSQPGAVPGAIAMAPVTISQGTFYSGARSVSGEVIGTTQSYAYCTQFQVSAGRFIESQDLAASSPVVVLGSTIERQLFGSVNPIGQSLTISGIQFDVVGVLKSMGFYGSDNLDNRVIIPQTTMWSRLVQARGDLESQIVFRTATAAAAVQVASEVDATLLQLHQLSNPFQANFSIVTQSQLVASQLSGASTLERTLLVVSAIALVLSSFYVYFRVSRGRLSQENIEAKSAALAVLLYDVTVTSLVSSLVGVFLAVMGAVQVVDLLAPSVTTIGHISLYDSLISVALGIAFSVVGLLPFVRSHI